MRSGTHLSHLLCLEHGDSSTVPYKELVGNSPLGDLALCLCWRSACKRMMENNTVLRNKETEDSFARKRLLSLADAYGSGL